MLPSLGAPESSLVSAEQLDRLAATLRQAATTDEGRMYAGRLAKFEPSDMQRIKVPRIDPAGTPADQET